MDQIELSNLLRIIIIGSFKPYSSVQINITLEYLINRIIFKCQYLKPFNCL